MTKAYVRITRHSVAVETWVSCDNNADVSALQEPFPGNIRHHIKVYWTGGYPTDFELHGQIAQGYSQLRFDLSGDPDNWNKPLRSVNTDAAENCGMKVDAGTVTARIQCTGVRFKSAWSGWVTALSTPLEVQVSVS